MKKPCTSMKSMVELKSMRSNYRVCCMKLKVPSDPHDPLGRGTWQGYYLKLEGDEFTLYCSSRGHISYENLKYKYDKYVNLLRYIEVYEIKDKKVPLIWKVGL